MACTPLYGGCVSSLNACLVDPHHATATTNTTTTSPPPRRSKSSAVVTTASSWPGAWLWGLTVTLPSSLWMTMSFGRACRHWSLGRCRDCRTRWLWWDTLSGEKPSASQWALCRALRCVLRTHLSGRGGGCLCTSFCLCVCMCVYWTGLVEEGEGDRTVCMEGEGGKGGRGGSRVALVMRRPHVSVCRTLPPPGSPPQHASHFDAITSIATHPT